MDKWSTLAGCYIICFMMVPVGHFFSPMLQGMGIGLMVFVSVIGAFFALYKDENQIEVESN